MSGCIIYHSHYQCMMASAVPHSHHAQYYPPLIFVNLVDGDCHNPAIVIPLITSTAEYISHWVF